MSDLRLILDEDPVFGWAWYWDVYDWEADKSVKRFYEAPGWEGQKKAERLATRYKHLLQRFCLAYREQEGK